MTASELLDRRFRTKPEYDIIVADQLDADEARAAGDLVRSPDFYGVLRARREAGRRPTKAIDRETALLLFTLNRAGPIPAFARARLGDDATRVLWQMVVDGVLEVEVDGSFVSGAAALQRLGTSSGREDLGHLSRLSRAALLSAASWPLAPVERQAFHLYSFGRLPCTPRWRRSLSDGDSVLAFLEAGRGERRDRPLERWWSRSHSSERWLHWRSAHGSVPFPRAGEATYKLYVSPTLAALPGAWSATLDVCAAGGAFEVKVGAGVAGLLRPDKLVAYFAGMERLSQAAERLAERLAGVPAHGVPFSAEIAGEGLLSWGLDPSSAGPAWDSAWDWSGAGGGVESWRAWLCLELARGLSGAQAEGADAEGAVQVALARLRHRGVDVETWSAAAALERRFGGGA